MRVRRPPRAGNLKVRRSVRRIAQHNGVQNEPPAPSARTRAAARAFDPGHAPSPSRTSTLVSSPIINRARTPSVRHGPDIDSSILRGHGDQEERFAARLMIGLDTNVRSDWRRA